jgi:hypothetical protein
MATPAFEQKKLGSKQTFAYFIQHLENVKRTIP